MFKGKDKVNKAVFEGQNVHVNPSIDTSMKRKKARLVRIRSWRKDESKTERYPEKAVYLEKAAKRLELEIELREGDF